MASVVTWSQWFRATGSAAVRPMGGSRRPWALAGERDWLLSRLAEKPDVTLRALLAELAKPDWTLTRGGYPFVATSHIERMRLISPIEEHKGVGAIDVEQCGRQCRERAVDSIERLPVIPVGEKSECQVSDLMYECVTVTDKLARPIVQYGPERQKQLGDVPFALDLLTNEDDKLLMQAAFAPLALGEPEVMPPGVPADRVDALRKALADTFADPEFLAEADRIALNVNAPRSGAQLQDSRAYQSPSRVIECLHQLNNP